MKNEFPITRKFMLTLRKVTSLCFGVISDCTSYHKDFNKKCITECESIVNQLKEDYHYLVWSSENRPIMIKELLDSVECRAQLQANYDIWIKMALNVDIWRDDDLIFLLEKNPNNPIAGVALLQEVRLIMAGFFWLIQELKMEYDLHDKEYYRPMAFMYIDYPNGPDDEETTDGETSNKKVNNIASYMEGDNIEERLSEAHKVNGTGRRALRRIIKILFPTAIPETGDTPTYDLFNEEFPRVVGCKTEYHFVLNQMRDKQKMITHTKFE